MRTAFDMRDEPIMHNTADTDQDYLSLLREVEELREANRKLQDQLKKTERAAANAEKSAAEAVRAHAKMVETLTETMRENNSLAFDRDMWKARAQRASTHHTVREFDLHDAFGVGNISEEEAKAIRKAMARLHHPDSGGNAERMKLWNAALDRIEHGQ